MSQAYSYEEAERKLQSLALEWSLPADGQLHREFKFDDFKQALAFVNKVGALAEDQNHHPEIKLGWGKVDITLSTHEASGLTDKDFKLAKAIDAI